MLATHDPCHSPDYFNILPSSSFYCSSESADSLPTTPGETPPSPYHPLLAYRGEQLHIHDYLTARISNLMAMQTSAAHAHPHQRPRPQPTQNVLHVTSDDSTTSSASSSSKSSVDITRSSPEFARCSRCQRTPSTDIRTGLSNMIQYGLNLWYCNRCAAMVGLVKR